MAKNSRSDEAYRRRKRKTRRNRARVILIIFAVLILAAIGVLVFLTQRTYHNYKITASTEKADTVSTKYVELDGKFLKYSAEEVALVTKDLETVWSETHSMQNPVADVNGKRVVIADKDGTRLEMYDKNGLTGSCTTAYTIVKASISSGGLVAAILDSGEDTWINYYGTDGSLIAENQTRIDDPGYPMDVAISNDGIIMMVTYQFVKGGETTSYVAFYNFGNAGQNEENRIVSGYEYDGIVIPQVEYLSGTHSVAIRDDGFVIYEGRQVPKESTTVNFNKEIVSTFYDKDTVGLVFRNDDSEKLYTMQVYDAGGRLKFSKDFNIPYTSIRISDGCILMYNSSQMCVIDSKGKEKYMGTVDGTINDFFKIGWNRYLLVLDSGVQVIKLT
ncbi:MAG: hypothetical protein IJ123_04485 [Blautia sp.]|nr:hypothetical protein [Blautia sp.]